MKKSGLISLFGLVAFLNLGIAAAGPVFQMRLAYEKPANNAERMAYVTGRDGVSFTNVLYVDKAVLFDETALKSARADKDSLGHPIVDIHFNRDATKRFADFTRQNTRKRLAIIIDGKVYEAPIIMDEIPGGEAQIAGRFTRAETKALAAKITAALRKD